MYFKIKSIFILLITDVAERTRKSPVWDVEFLLKIKNFEIILVHCTPPCRDELFHDVVVEKGPIIMKF